MVLFRRLMYYAANKPGWNVRWDVLRCLTLFSLVWMQWLLVAVCIVFLASLCLDWSDLFRFWFGKRLCFIYFFGNSDLKSSESNSFPGDIKFAGETIRFLFAIETFARSNPIINLLNWILWICSVSCSVAAKVWEMFSIGFQILFLHRIYIHAMHVDINCVYNAENEEKTTHHNSNRLSLMRMCRN